MRAFRADLHIHSRYSRATSRKLTPLNLIAWAAVKGLDVLGSGDFTHARWREELKETLVYDEPSGLYRLREGLDISRELPEYTLPESASQVRFMLQGEISSIYKRGGKVRKIHNLVFMPDFEAAEAFCERLSRVGNLESDGRPILGLDSRDLLEMVLEAAPNAFLIPAHIWTPWFSLFGSKSGFDSLEECYGDLASEVFALETGLSSDPEMNRLWSHLDAYRLISNSDAHSGENLGREANLFTGEMSYQGIVEAMKNRAENTRFLGTLEFFPEEGKYHLDGHRKCDISMEPEETRQLNGLCPVCGKPVTVGVLHRVVELADRKEAARPEGETSLHLIPLPELLGEILGVGAKSKKVGLLHAKAIARLGSELEILHSLPEDELERFLPPLAEGVARMRRGEVFRLGGFDGEYGVVRVFTEQEQREMVCGTSLAPGKVRPSQVSLVAAGTEDQAGPEPERRMLQRSSAAGELLRKRLEDARAAGVSEAFCDAGADDADAGAQLRPNPEQRAAIEAGPGPLLVLAGPGTGKTRTLVLRVEELIRKGESPRNILAVTFTRKAAAEMDARLALALEGIAASPRTDTLHALAFELWHKTHDEAPTLLSEEAARRVFEEANGQEAPQLIREAWERLALARERRESVPEALQAFQDRYAQQKTGWNLADYTDLLEFWLEQAQSGLYTSPWTQVLVDEIQDLSPLQLALIRTLLPPDGKGFFGIGDPDQSIYGFRGALGGIREYLAEAWPDLHTVVLRENYRSPGIILQAASAVLGEASACGELIPAHDVPGRIHLFDAPNAEGEAAWIAGQVSALIGMGSHSLADAEVARSRSLLGAGELAPGDIAILVRLRSLAQPLKKALARYGIPVSAPESEAFWADARVALLLRAAGRMLGIADGLDGEEPLCPDKVFARGPLGLSSYLAATPPFDMLFWRSAAFKALSKAYERYGGWAGLINWVHLQTDLELVRSRSEQVQIMSLHAAKGLEFRAVFLAGVEDGLLPFAGMGMLTGSSDKDLLPPDPEEERRLFYVGLTRARQSLFITHAMRRMVFGKEIRLKESRFLHTIPAELLTRSALVPKQRLDETQLSLFS